jgi:2-phosphinomethylmalic acid synthase
VADAAHPAYFPHAFPPEGFPAYVWERPPADLPPSVWTTETTHRDGQQGGLPLDATTSLAIYDLLCRFTNASGAIRQAEFFVYRAADRRALEGALERWRTGAPIEPTTWIRASRDDVRLVRTLGVRETGMLASASDFHTFHKFKPGGRRAAAVRYLDAVRDALDAGVRPRLHLEDATRAPSDFVRPFVEAVMAVAEPYGTELRPKFRVCDTLGVGLPFDGVALPRSVPGRIRELRSLGLEAADLEFHPHNDTHLVVANCVAAVLAGCAVINGAALGKGERSGNAPLEAVLVHLSGLGFLQSPAPDFRVLNDLVTLYEGLGEPVPPKYPLFGRDAHRTRAGIHADGLTKFWWMYAPFDVPALLGRPLEVSLTKDSGVAGVQYLLRQHLGLDLGKHDPRVIAVAAWVDAQFEAGRSTGIEWEELEGVARAAVARRGGGAGSPLA